MKQSFRYAINKGCECCKKKKSLAAIQVEKAADCGDQVTGVRESGENLSKGMVNYYGKKLVLAGYVDDIALPIIHQ